MSPERRNPVRVTGFARSAWGAFGDEWDRDRDPALRRMRDALAQAEQEALGRPEPTSQRDAIEPEPALPEASKQARVAQLVARIRSGDLSAVDALRRLIE